MSALGEARVSRLILSMVDAKLEDDLVALAADGCGGGGGGGGGGTAALGLLLGAAPSGSALMAAALCGRTALLDDMLKVGGDGCGCWQ